MHETYLQNICAKAGARQANSHSVSVFVIPLFRQSSPQSEAAVGQRDMVMVRFRFCCMYVVCLEEGFKSIIFIAACVKAVGTYSSTCSLVLVQSFGPPGCLYSLGGTVLKCNVKCCRASLVPVRDSLTRYCILFRVYVLKSVLTVRPPIVLILFISKFFRYLNIDVITASMKTLTNYVDTY